MPLIDCGYCGGSGGGDGPLLVCPHCKGGGRVFVPEPEPEREDDEPADPDATPVMRGDDPDDFISGPPGGEG
jgi:hypothetical protein